MKTPKRTKHNLLPKPTSEILSQNSGNISHVQPFIGHGQDDPTNHYASLLRRCGNAKALSLGRRLHKHIRVAGYERDRYVGNLLVEMYGKCGDLEDARLVFANMGHRNVFSWNLMIGAYVQNGLDRDALRLFQEMLQKCVAPDTITFVSVLTACANELALAEGKWMHTRILRLGFESHALVSTALVNMFAKCGCLENARMMFDQMNERDVVSWNSMIVAYAQHGKGRKAFQLLLQMQMEGLTPTKVTLASIFDACASFTGLPEGKQIHAGIINGKFQIDVPLGTALVNMYAKCGRLEDARGLFEAMPERNVVSWSAMIAAYALHGLSEEVLHLSRRMQLDGVIPNKVTLVSILCACSHAGLVEEGRYWFNSMAQDYGISPIEEHYNCMIDLLGRAGRLDQVDELLQGMPFKHSAMPWMTLLGACKMHLDVERGKHAAEVAMNLDPENAAPYVLLSNIYSGLGMWEDAERLRKSMDDKGLRLQMGMHSSKIRERDHEMCVEDQIHQCERDCGV